MPTERTNRRRGLTTGMSNAERLRVLRADAVARGLCFTCRCRAVRAGTRYCDVCIQRAADYKASIAYVKCETCGADVRGRGTLACDACTAKDTARATARRADFLARGLCGSCGLKPCYLDRSECSDCLDENKDRQLLRNREAGHRPGSPCSICSSLGLSGTGHNRRSHDRWMERRKQWTP